MPTRDDISGDTPDNSPHASLDSESQSRSVRALLGSFLSNWVGPAVFALAVLTPFRAAIADWYDVPSGSMRPTILEGDRIVVWNAAFGLRVPLTNTWLARWDSPQRGDIVTLGSPEDGIRLVKRVVGLPGDRIELRHNQLFVNGQPIAQEQTTTITEERFENRPPFPGHLRREWLTDSPHYVTDVPSLRDRDLPAQVVPAGHVYVMGDNRDLSKDSRVFGPVPIELVRGRATHIAVSVDPERAFRPRFARWFSALG